MRRRDLLGAVLGVAGAGPAVGPPALASDTPSDPARDAAALLPPAPMLLRRTLPTDDGISLSVLQGGPDPAPRGPPLVFVPGWCMPAGLFRPQLEHFARTRRVYALDPRGQGESDAPAHGYTLERRAADIDALLLALARPAVVVAWSLAGLEVLHLSPRAGARIAALALVDSSVGEGPGGSGKGTADFAAALRRDRRATLEGFARAIFRTPPPEAAIAALADAMQRMPLEASIALLDYGVPRSRWRTLAHAWRGPLLYAVTPQYQGQATLLARARPATRVALFADAGHALFADAPDRFNAVLSGFIAGVR